MECAGKQLGSPEDSEQGRFLQVSATAEETKVRSLILIPQRLIPFNVWENLEQPREKMGGIEEESANLTLKEMIERESEVAQSCPTLCDPMDCSLLCSSVHGILQARILEWVAISFFRGSSRPRDRTWVSRIVGRRFTI